MEPQISTQEIKENLSNRLWRLDNLYFVKDEDGNKVQFKMNDVQREIHDNLWFFTIIPKARQLGVTTFFSILYLDQVLFSENKTAVIIAHRQEDMKKIFSNKVKFAWDEMHEWVKAMIGIPNTDNANELKFPNGSSISVSMTTRSGTVQFLRISEFGYICQKTPERAEEIVTGAINSVHSGNMVSIESTAKGREGYFYDFCMDADKNAKEGKTLTTMDFKLMFFPWWIDGRYVLSGDVVIDAENERYFDLLDRKYGVKLSKEQKNFYIKKKQMNRDKIFQEYPSTLEECFQTSVEGAYYAKEMERVYLTQRIKDMPHDPMYKVDTYWDLGINDDCVILFVQSIGPQIRYIDTYASSGEGLAHYVGYLEKMGKERGFRYGKHVFPWDVESKDVGSGLTRKETLYKLGLTDIRTAPKMGIQDGIDKIRGLFPKFYFDEVHTKPLSDALANYRKDWDPKNGVFKDHPKHDKNSHWADAVRTLGVTWMEEDDGGDPELAEERKKAMAKDASFFG